MKQIDKLDIADEFLEQSIESYLDHSRYVSAIHLAGAAQEIYETLIKGNREQNFSTIVLNQLEKHAKSSGSDFDRNEILQCGRYPRNSVKHMDKKNDRFTYINPEIEAMTLVLEAITDAMLLKKKETENIKRFKEHFMQKMQAQ
jgi:hypothetical protein